MIAGTCTPAHLHTSTTNSLYAGFTIRLVEPDLRLNSEMSQRAVKRAAFLHIQRSLFLHTDKSRLLLACKNHFITCLKNIVVLSWRSLPEDNTQNTNLRLITTNRGLQRMETASSRARCEHKLTSSPSSRRKMQGQSEGSLNVSGP